MHSMALVEDVRNYFAGAVAFLVAFTLWHVAKKAGRKEKAVQASADDVLRLLHSGRRLQAIKAVRDVSGISIAEAQDAIKKAEQGDTSLLRRYIG